MEQQILQTPSDPVIHNKDVHSRITTTHIKPAFLFGLCLSVVILFILGGSAFLTIRWHTLLPLLWTLAAYTLFMLLFLATAKQRAIISYLWETRNNPIIKPYAKLYISLESILHKYENALSVSEDDANARNVQDVVRDQKNPLMLLGSPGVGKTTVLRVYQYRAFRYLLQVIVGREKIPMYIQMKDYNAFLMKEHQAALKKSEEPQHVPFLEYLTKYIHQNADTSFHHLHRYLPRLMKQGRLLFLCDGLNEVDSRHLGELCKELKQIMRGNAANRVVMTCREVDYNGQSVLQELVGPEYAQKEHVQPLQTDQIRGFIAKYLEVGHDVDKYSTVWQHSVGEFFEVIERGRLNKYCTNPHVLITLMRTINGMTLDKGLALHTRGRLYQAYVHQFVDTALQKERYENPPEADALIEFLSELACTGRRAGFRVNISLLPKLQVSRGILRQEYPLEEIADRLYRWLDDPQISEEESLATLDDLHLIPIHIPYSPLDIKRYLQFAHRIGLIAISSSGDISFQHEVVGEYLAAEYLLRLDEKNKAEVPFIDELVEDMGAWSQPIALWAGLLPDSMMLANRLATSASQFSSANLKQQLNALALSLTCVGVVWASSHVQPSPINLPENVLRILRRFINDPKARTLLAPILRNCAEEGGLEVYKAFLPLLSNSKAIEGSFGKLLLDINDPSIVDIIFDSLEEVIDKAGYELHVKGAKTVLGQFGEASLQRAIALSHPSCRNKHLRIVAIEILGLTQTRSSVQPLLNLLEEADAEFYQMAMGALVILNPKFTFEPLAHELQNSSVPPQIQGKVLQIIRDIFAREESQPRISSTLHQRMIDVVVQVLSSQYPYQAQQLARVMLLGQATPSVQVPDRPYMRVILTLIRSLSTTDGTMADNLMTLLKQIGSRATPSLLKQLEVKPTAIERARIFEILGDIGDPAALFAFLAYITDPPPVAEVVAHALANSHYASASTPELIKRVTSLQFDDAVASKAARILIDIGEICVVPACKVLLSTPPQRIRLLVSVLVQIHDPQAVPPLIELLKASRNNITLATDMVRSLSDFQDELVVAALIDTLEHSFAFPSFYEATYKALSSQGDIAIDDILAVLDAMQETPVTRGAVLALAGMKPFPDDRLLTAFEHCTDAQAQHIQEVFLLKQIDTAPFLVYHLCHRHQRVREYVRKTVDRMDEPMLVPPLLNVLGNLSNCGAIANYLLKYPGCIPQLVQKLGDPVCNDAARDVLVRFDINGKNILPPLRLALNEPKDTSQRYAQEILVSLAHHDAATLPRIVRLFSYVAAPDMHSARGALVHVLTNDLASIIQPILLDELVSGDLAIKEGVSDALMHLVHEHDAQRDTIISDLIHTLERAEYRVGAEMTLIKIRDLAVEPVSKFITDKTFGNSARSILSHIGAPAFPIIWSAYSNVNDVERREAARMIFHNMPTRAIRDDLVSLLTSSKPLDFEMALTLLVERINEDASLLIDKQEMIPSLLEHIYTHQHDESNQRILAFLLVLPKRRVIDHFVRALYRYPDRSAWMIPAFLLIGMEGKEARETLSSMLQGNLSPTLLSNVMSVLGMMEAHQKVVERAELVGYGMNPEERMVALHALGGLLAGGRWDHTMLETLLNNSKDGSSKHELYSLLLGMPYAIRLAHVQKELSDEKQAHEADNRQHRQNIARLQLNLQEKEHERARLTRTLDETRYEANKAATLEARNRILTESNSQLNANVRELVHENEELKLRVRRLESSNNFHSPHL